MKNPLCNITADFLIATKILLDKKIKMEYNTNKGS